MSEIARNTSSKGLINCGCDQIYDIYEKFVVPIVMLDSGIALFNRCVN